MRKVWITAALAALPWGVMAQVVKEVEVTKAYVPRIERAEKLAIEPDMTDTTRMRPEIDYTITPLSFPTTLQTRPIRPAQVTYWEFNRPLPFYLKVGAGYPLRSVLDFHVSTQNPGTGYAALWLNHTGDWADIRNDYGERPNSIRTANRLGAAAGKYFGRRILELRVQYEDRLYHRYGAFRHGFPQASGYAPGALVDYGDAGAAFRFGDDFLDLARTNFEVALDGGLFFDRSRSGARSRARETSLGARAKVARSFGRHSFAVEAGYDRSAGQKALADTCREAVHAALRYGIEGGVAQLEAGADYWYDKTTGADGRHYVVPFLRLRFDLGTRVLKPFAEADGGVRPNDFRTLTRLNPYVANPSAFGDASNGGSPAPFGPVPVWLRESSVDYNFRFGIGGNIWRERLDYRVYAAFSVRDAHLYWLAMEATGSGGEVYNPGAFMPVQGRQTVTSFHGRIAFRPLSELRIDVGVHGFLYNDEERWNNGESAFRADAGIRYAGRKFSVGIDARFETRRTWTVAGTTESSFTAPAAVDLGIGAEWKITGSAAVFAEGRNLLDRKIYRTAFYPDYGASVVAGVRLEF